MPDLLSELEQLARVADDADQAVTDFENEMQWAASNRANVALDDALTAKIVLDMIGAARLLTRIRAWDMMDVAADGKYWRKAIDTALAQLEERG